MNQFVQGTIIPVVWRFERPNGNKFFISIYDITLQLIHPRGVENIMPVVGDGFITFTLMPQLQKSLGKYSLRLSASLNGEQVLRCEQKDFLMITSKRYASTAVEMMADAPTVELLTVAEFGLFGDGITADEVQALLKDKVSKSYVDALIESEAEDRQLSIMEVNNDLKSEVNRAKAMENALMQEHSELYGSIMQETQRAEAAETALQEKTKHISSDGEDTTEVTGDFVVNGMNIVDSIGDLEDKTDSIIEDVNQLQGYTGYVANIAKGAEDTANKAKAIAEGKATGYVFNTVADMNAWITQHKAGLHLGDNLYIRDTNVPDYWWDGTQAQELETQKVDLDDYYTKAQSDQVFETILNSQHTSENLWSAIEGIESTCSARTEALATDIAALENNKQDALVAGDNISIEGSVISSTVGGNVDFEEEPVTGDIPEIHVIPDAPVDGKQYARKDGTWSEVQGGSSDWELLVDNTTTEVVSSIFHQFEDEYKEFVVIASNLQNAGTAAGPQIYFELRQDTSGNTGILTAATPIQASTTAYQTTFVARITVLLGYLLGSISIKNNLNNLAGSQNMTHREMGTLHMNALCIHLANAAVNKIASGFNYQIYGRK